MLKLEHLFILSLSFSVSPFPFLAWFVNFKLKRMSDLLLQFKKGINVGRFEVSKVLWKMLVTTCVEPRHIKGYRYKPTARESSGRYKPYSNVDSFLKICKILGLTGIDLFSPSDVVEKKNTRKVCMCIRFLSKKARSKRLNVPDFDIVTYTVVMPTNMVGCIRRSLELSQCSSVSSASDNVCRNSRAKCEQKNLVAPSSRSDDYHSEDSCDAESNYMRVQSATSYASESNSVYLQMHTELENSLEVSSGLKNNSSAQNVLHTDVEDQELEQYMQNQCELKYLSELVASQYRPNKESDQLANMFASSSIDSQMRLNTRSLHINSELGHSHENVVLDLVHADLDLANEASVVGDSTDDSVSEISYFAHQLAISNMIDHGTDNSNVIWSADEESASSVCMDSEFYGSNSTNGTSEIGFGRRISDYIEEVEVLSIGSMNSVSGRMQHLDFEDHSDEENVLETAIVQFPEKQNDMAGLMKMISVGEFDMVQYKALAYDLTSEIEKGRFNMKVEEPATPRLPCLEWPLYATSSTDDYCTKGVCMSPISSDIANHDGKLLSHLAGCLSSKGILENGDRDQTEEFLLDQSVSSSGFVKWDDKHKSVSPECYESDGQRSFYDFCCTEDTDQMDAQDERKHEKLEALAVENSDGRGNTDPGTSERMSHSKILLKSVVSGAAFVSVLFLLQHLRKRSGAEKTDGVRKQPGQSYKTNGVVFSQKGQKGGWVTGVYPDEKLKLG